MNYRRIIFCLLIVLFPATAWPQIDFSNIPKVSSIEDMLSVAVKQQRKPYRNGAEGPNAFDCSGFTRFCYRLLGIELERTSQAQSERGKKIRRRKLKEGDLVFFKGNSGNDINHVGIVYKKNGGEKFDFIHASTSSGIVIESSETEYFKKRYKTARRITSDKKIRDETKAIIKEQKAAEKERKDSIRQLEKETKSRTKEDKQQEKHEIENNSHPEAGTDPTPPSQPDSEASASSQYVVRSGDTLYNISKRMNCSVEELRKWNDLKDNTISIGQTLIIKQE